MDARSFTCPDLLGCTQVEARVTTWNGASHVFTLLLSGVARRVVNAGLEGGKGGLWDSEVEMK